MRARTSQPLLRLLLALVFVALLLSPLVLRRLTQAAPAGVAGTSRAAALARYGFALEDVSRAAGIHFTHESPTLDARLAPIMPVVASVGASVSIVDFDRDGRPDIYVTNSAVGSENALYRNRGDGTFEDVAPRLGIADVNLPGTGVSMGAVWGDYDNDGYEDLFLYKWGRVELYHNDRGHGFTRVTEQAGLPRWMNANTAVWLDYDRDGRLDLFVGAYFPEQVDLWHLGTTRILPESFEYAQNGGRNYLFHNLGNGRFEEVGQAMGLTSTRWTLAAAAADVNGDGYPDLFVANDFGTSELYLNEQGKRFREIGRSSNVGRTPKSGMNATFGDALNRGQLDLFVSNIAEPGVLLHGNDFWVPSADSGQVPQYRDMAGPAGVELAGWSYGAQFGDLNNDGWLDLYLTNGFLSGEKRESYWYDYSMVAGGNNNIIADARNWPAVAGRSMSGHQRDRVWLNDGAGRFQDVSAAVGVKGNYDGRAVALADLWNRGALDVVVANQHGPLQLYRSSVVPANHWLTLDLEGTRSNRSAIGAEVRLYWAGMEQVQQVTGGSGFAAENDRRLHFGLGRATRVERLVIRWPSGTVQTIAAPAVDHFLKVREP
ncbi:MAG TPA: CRTAC1 family protein [Longimicrobiales bacterium]